MSRPPKEQAQINAKNADEIYERICNEEGIFECITLWLDLLGFKHHLDKDTSLYVDKTLFDKYRPKIMETWKLDKMIELNNFGKFFKVRSIEF